jgi:hypothetical protein
MLLILLLITINTNNISRNARLGCVVLLYNVSVHKVSPLFLITYFHVSTVDYYNFSFNSQTIFKVQLISSGRAWAPPLYTRTHTGIYLRFP